MNKEDKILQKKYKAAVRPPRKNIDFSQSGYKQMQEEDARPVIEVKFAGFGNKDSDDDILIKGCMSKSIQEHGAQSSSNRKIAFLWQHDMKDPIGKSLLEEEREDGAYGRVKMSNFDAVPNSKRAFTQMEEGVLNQFSIGYWYVWDKLDYDEKLEAFIVKEIGLYEYSVVTAGANEQTQYDGIFQSTEDMKSYLKVMREHDPDRYEQLKQFILQENEPSRASKGNSLTHNYMLGNIAEILINTRN